MTNEQILKMSKEEYKCNVCNKKIKRIGNVYCLESPKDFLDMCGKCALKIRKTIKL